MGTNHSVDYLIIGAGPAGLQLAYCLHRRGRSYVVLEAGSTAGAFYVTYPRHRRLLSINKVYTGHTDPELNLRWDWNSLLTDSYSLPFAGHSTAYLPDADDMTAYLAHFADANELNVHYDTTVTTVSKDETFRVRTGGEAMYEAGVLIVATGIPEPYVPPIPGIEHAVNYATMSVDPEAFLGRRVLVIGKGNSAFETADSLVPTTSRLHVVSPNPVRLAWDSTFVGDVRAVNNTFLETYRLKSQNAVIDADIVEIDKDDGGFTVTFDYLHAPGEQEQLRYDDVIVCTGFGMDGTIFDATCRPDRAYDGKLPTLTLEWQSTNVDDLYFAGTLMQSRDYRKTQSAFIHGFRYNVRMLASILEEKYEDLAIPCQRLATDGEAIANKIVDRINRSSAMWQQPGYFCDAVLLHGDEADYFEDLTVDYVGTVLAPRYGATDHLTITLEFNHDLMRASESVFAMPRPHKDDARSAASSPSLHPIVRLHVGGEPAAEHHVIEDFASEWREPVHVDPLKMFLSESVSQRLLV